MTAHWGIADPAAVEGTDVEKAFAFRRALKELESRITLLLSLPITSLDGMKLPGVAPRRSESQRTARTLEYAPAHWLPLVGRVGDRRQEDAPWMVAAWIGRRYWFYFVDARSRIPPSVLPLPVEHLRGHRHRMCRRSSGPASRALAAIPIARVLLRLHCRRRR